MTNVRTHLMFQGDAAAAMALYADVFADFLINSATYNPNDATKVQQAAVTFGGHDLIIIDSPAVHDFTFTPSMSLFVDFDRADSLDAAFARLSDGGAVMMSLGDYGFSQRFGWCKDRFGVSWQLNLP